MLLQLADSPGIAMTYLQINVIARNEVTKQSNHESLIASPGKERRDRNDMLLLSAKNAGSR